MRILRPLTIAGLLLISACYQQPVISPQRPLRCNPAEAKSECPKGLTCVPIGVCAPNSCQKNEDCPVGLACSSRGCVLPGDGGVGDAGAIQIPVLPDASQALDSGLVPDAAVPEPDVLSPSTPDGGNG